MAWKYNCASGAIPLMFPDELVPSPRTEPATCVPWPSISDAPSSAIDPHEDASEGDMPQDTMSRIWSEKSACMVESFTPLSSPESATVTTIPLPSTPSQEELIPFMVDCDQRSGALRIVSATSFAVTAHNFSSTHSISSCATSQASPVVVRSISKVAKRPTWYVIRMSSR